MFKRLVCGTKYKKNINANNSVPLTVCKCTGRFLRTEEEFYADRPFGRTT